MATTSKRVKVNFGPKPKTAYGLLMAVKRVILAEPKRVNMDLWLDKHVTPENSGDSAPACGTVGCIAGWCKAVMGRRLPAHVVTHRLLGFKMEHNEWGSEEDHSTMRTLFYPESWPTLLRQRLGLLTPGTARYAQVVADRIDAFIAEHRTHLKRTKI